MAHPWAVLWHTRHVLPLLGVARPSRIGAEGRPIPGYLYRSDSAVGY